MVSSTLRIRHPSVAWLGPPWGGFLAMQKFTMKLWTIAAGAAAATTLAAPPALAHPEDEVVIASPSDFVYPTGFDKALSLMLAGECGENGIGSHLFWPTLSFPALSPDQLPNDFAVTTLAIPLSDTHTY